MYLINSNFYDMKKNGGHSSSSFNFQSWQCWKLERCWRNARMPECGARNAWNARMPGMLNAGMWCQECAENYTKYDEQIISPKR